MRYAQHKPNSSHAAPHQAPPAAPSHHPGRLSATPLWAQNHPPVVQTKLAINQPGDRYEQEADRVAETVMRMPEPQVQRKCAACEEEEQVQRQPLEEEEEELQMKEAAPAAAPATAPPIVQSALSAPGRPLDAGTRASLEPRFGADFSGVRVHTDAQAAESAQAINARAYTVGRDVVFGAGQYAPQTGAGRRLIAHELAHVVQQGEQTFLPIQREVFVEFQTGDKITITGDTSIGSGTFDIAVNRDDETTIYGELLDADGNTSGTIIEAKKVDLIDYSPYSPPTSTSEPAPTVAQPIKQDAYQGPGWSRVNEVGIVRVEEESAKVRGARVRAGPLPNMPILGHLSENTDVFVIAENTKTKWIYVNVVDSDSKSAGIRGYIYRPLVWRKLPDPDAELYYVAEQGIGLQKLVENHPQYDDYDIRTGDDARSIVMAVLTANEQDSRTKGHVYLNQEKLQEANDAGLWEGTLDAADEYRRVLRPIFQSVELLHGKKIWLPGKAYVNSLKGKGIIPTRADWKNVAIDITKGVSGFVVGVVEGLVRSVVDVFVGIYDLVKSVITTVIDLISGELIDKAEEVIDTLDEMMKDKSPGEVATELLTMLKSAVTGMVQSIFNDFKRRWTSANTYNAWHFRGLVVGYILAEVLMAIFSGGAATAAKWLGKLGKFGSKLAKVLMKVFDKIDDVFAKLPGRKSRRKGDRDQDVDPQSADGGSQKAKQFPLAMTLARNIAEMHDEKDSPVTLAVASLLPLKTKFKWIDRFSYKKKSKGHYKILMYASPPHDVDRDYTTEVLADQVEAAQQGVRDEPPEGTHREISAYDARIKYVHDRGVEQGKILAVNEGLSPIDPTTNKGWDNPYEFDGSFGRGIDDIMFDKQGNPVILEYKGSDSKLRGDQMEKSWICRKIRELADRNDPMASRLKKAMKDEKLTGRLYRTPVDDVGAVGTSFQEGDDWEYKGKC
jgi:hypothetical protein